MLQKRFKAQQIPFPAAELRDDVRKASLKLTRAYVAEVLQVSPGLAAAGAKAAADCKRDDMQARLKTTRLCASVVCTWHALLLLGLKCRQIVCVCFQVG